jgi:hypothetical protein
VSPCRRPGGCFRDQSNIRMPLGRDLVWGRTPERDLERYGTLNVIALVQGASSFLHAAVTDSIEDALKAKAMYSDRITKLRQTTQSFESKMLEERMRCVGPWSLFILTCCCNRFHRGCVESRGDVQRSYHQATSNYPVVRK